ncbi:MAG: PTS sugar transporter subunit IIC [Erysipelotrichaceae bacterium]|nr:PTS sugar transporter subunit IIC [Erysipelotrichaceae bacterium]
MHFTEKIEKVLMPIAEVISKNKYLISIRDGFLCATPLLIVGSFFMLLANFPIPAYMDWLRATEIFGYSLASIISVPANITFNLMAIFAIVGFGYSFSKQIDVQPGFGSVVGLVSWFMLMPQYTLFTPEGATEAVQVSSIPMAWVGAKGLFVGIFCVFLSSHIYKYIYNKGWVIKMPAGVPPTVEESFASLIPGGFVLLVFLFINFGFRLTPWGDAFNFIFNFLQLPLQNVGDSLGAMVIIYLFAHILWFFGIHGTQITDTVFTPILYSLSAENLTALQAGLPLPHIINKQFQDLFATYGGGGSTLSLLIAILLFCKSKRVTELAKLSIIPGIFGINEPVIFGLPIVLNPVIGIPFILLPMINIIVAYFAMSIGLVPICNGVIMPWTTPPIISGFLASGWQGSVLQFVMIIVGIFVYLPFIKTVDKGYLEEEEKAKLNATNDEVSFDDISFDEL